MIWNRPYHPRDNPKVERMQRTISRWVEIEKCATSTNLQTSLDEAAHIQREKVSGKAFGA
jgi:hypothetical protein